MSTKSLSEQRNGQNYSQSTTSFTSTSTISRSSRPQETPIYKLSGACLTLSLNVIGSPTYLGFGYRAGTVESRLRQLVMKLEFVESLQLAHPFIKGFSQVSHCLTEEEVRAVAQGEVSEAVAKRKKEEIEGKEGASTVHTSTFYIGLAIEEKKGMCLTICDPV